MDLKLENFDEQTIAYIASVHMQGCTEDIGSSRIMFLEMFTAKYDLELVAGNFLNSIGGGAAVDELLCRFS